MMLAYVSLLLAAPQPSVHAAPYVAQQPWFDSERYCKAIAANGGGQPSVVRGCLEHEALARRKMKVGVAEAIRLRCIQQGEENANGGSYLGYTGCVAFQEKRASWAKPHAHLVDSPVR